MLFVANWKMNLTRVEIYDLVEALKDQKSSIVLCPAFPYLSYVAHLTALSDIAVGAQDCSAFIEGAYTGDVSTQMLRDVGCSYVILGHSERRLHFGETSERLQQKIRRAQEYDLKVIYCIGETLEQREKGETLAVLCTQLKDVLSPGDEIIIAYEPVWAIGTGKAAQVEDVQEVISALQQDFDFTILYGGSVNPQNAKDLSSIKGLGGFLIGNASTKVYDFKEILTSCNA